MLRIEKVIVICREVNRQTGQIAVYALHAADMRAEQKENAQP